MNENCGPALGAIVAGACICLGAACSSTGWSVAEQTTEFPSAEEVRQLAAEPTPDVEFEEILQTAFVEQWSLVGDLPTTLGDR